MRRSDVQEQEERESLASSDHDFASIFSETEQNMILYQTFESVEEVKESSDLLQEFVQEKVETITQEVKKQKETFEEQNRKIDEMNRTLNKILNILKDKGAEQATEPFWIFFARHHAVKRLFVQLFFLELSFIAGNTLLPMLWEPPFSHLRSFFWWDDLEERLAQEFW